MSNEKENKRESKLELSIVLLGSFNPAIIHPNWLKSLGIIESSKLDELLVSDPKIKVSEGVLNPTFLNTSTFTRISIPERLDYKIYLERFEVVTIKEEFKDTLESVIKIFSILKHTPITAVGFNIHLHKKLKKGEVRDILSTYFKGKELQKKENKLIKLIGKKYDLMGTFKFNIRGSFLTLKIEPSNIGINNALYLGYNFHKDILKSQSVSAQEAVDYLKNTTVKNIEFAKSIEKAITNEEPII